MVEDSGVDELIRRWTAERSQDAELQEVNRIKSQWLADAPLPTPLASPGIPAQRARHGATGLFGAGPVDPAYVAAMRGRLPGVPDELLAGAASCWQLAGTVAEAEQWWDAGISPLDQRALDYRAAGLTPADLSRRLGPLTVLEHLRRGSAAAWCVARLNRQRS
ncbi:MAG: helix-turn-helix transcriptional regulator [Kutzneria sp.]|nr:helix-turn-helix transcriptional regulator [Kutzneria sp.]MBV9845739.1 helix-turn-helix transcriptional regulator [Kutzneria sp.]